MPTPLPPISIFGTTRVEQWIRTCEKGGPSSGGPRPINFCNGKKPSCFYPIPQATDCILHVVERANAPLIYLSRDAAESEIRLLQSLLVREGKHAPLVKLPPQNSAEK
ncbi:hypothetical protein LR48_Vigan04g221600 [Vigna angularis]|uniref:Uncharacterized protein n=1 Tax=Phaseolus angularis TaxID=3914 RepID=A0A0L9UGZ7_PHAAN|nr:hypothetical protein LR48_Vigan04g221600 [Vigna angularis]